MAPLTRDLDRLTPQQRALLARRLLAKRRQAAPAEDTAEAIPRRRHDGPVPASFPQRRLWFLEQLEPGSRAYHLGMAARLAGPLDEAALERSLAVLAERHEALRTTFRAVDGEPVQVVAAELAAALRRSSVADQPDPEAAARRRVAEERDRPFDLERGPLWRAHLIELGDADHLFLLVLHHIITDGWSQGILARELSLLYDTLRGPSNGGPPTASPLPELAVQYPDFAVWQHRWLAGEELARQLSYWRRQLRDLPALELPADHRRPTEPSYRGHSELLRLPRSSNERIAALAGEQGATPFMVLLAVFAALLGRTSGQRDFALGSPIANRQRAELEGVVGFFLNMLVLRFDLAGDATFSELLARTRSLALAAYSHQDLPFEKLVEELAPERQRSRSPLFQATFAVQNMERHPLALAELEARPVAGDEATTRFDLEVYAWEEPEGWQLTFIGNADLFAVTTLKRLARWYAALLASATAIPGRRLSQLSLLDRAQRHQLLGEWNDAAAEPAPRLCLHQPVRARAARTPRAVALVGAGRELTYGELVERAGRRAADLRHRGVGPGTLVGLCLDRGPEMVVALLAILEAGGAYVPLDPALPDERLAFMLRDAELPLLLTERRLESRLAGLVAADGPEVALIDEPLAAAAPNAAARPGDPGRPAYVIFTSGSTGRPKGVQVSHRNAAAFLHAMRRRPGLAAGDVLLAVTTLSFDIALLELLLPLWTGARVVIASREEASDGEALRRLIDERQVSVLQATPATWQLLLEAGWRPAQGLRMLCGGEALPRRLAEQLLAGGGELWNLYGPTETTVWSASERLAPGAEVTIGRPIASTRLVVVDRRLRPVPVGVPGELCIGGAGVARGYLGRPALTAERFVPEPYFGQPLASPGGRLYRTGDLARSGADGRLTLLGRLDHQIKLRGFRIELGEIEAVLEEHPALTRAVVVLHRGDERPDRDRLIAWWLAAAEPAPAGSELAAHLQAKLPAHMVPAVFVHTDELPLTAGGKVDRAALARRELPAAGQQSGGGAPRDPFEEAVAEAFATLLRRDRVDTHESFFSLGGHSLLATQLVSRLRELFRIELPLREVFETPTVAGLARRVEAALGVGVQIAASPIGRAERRSPLPLSFAQERLWFLEQLEPGSPMLNLPAGLELRGRLSVSALRAALCRVVRRHEALRTTFRKMRGQPVQVISAAVEAPLPEVDLAHLPESRRRLELDRRQRRDAAAPFDLARGPLLRALLLRLAEDHHVLLLNLHHIVSDGWSIALLLGELTTLYRAGLEGRPPALPELAVQVADVAVWQRRWLAGGAMESQVDYWRQQLTEPVAVLELPADRPRAALASYRGGSVSRRLDGDLSGRLEELGGRRGATLFMTLLTAFKVLLARLAGQPDVVVGCPVAGRRRGESEPLIGAFLNTLVLRTDLAEGTGSPTFEEALDRVRQVTLDAYSHQDVPFEMLLAELQPERDLSRTPLFQVFFNMLQLPTRVEPVPGLELEMLSLADLPAKFDLTVYAARRPRGVDLRWVYNADLFDAARMEEMAEQYVALLARVAARPEERIDRVSLLTEGARKVLPDPTVELSAAFRGAVHDLFADHARRSPGRLAVLDRDGQLTYGELAALAGWLADELTAAGVGRGDAVMIHAYRSAALVWAILGVLEAGAAFVILDPAHPAERQLLTLEQSGARFWLETPGSTPPEEVSRAVAEHFGEGHWLRLPEHRCWRQLRRRGKPAPRPRLGADDIACISFTSGSTGVPKGICCRHGSLTHFLPWQQRTFGLRPDDRFSMTSGVAHDPLQRDIFTPFQLGATVVIPDPEHMFQPGWLTTWLARERITVVHLTPALGRLLVAAPSEQTLPKLRYAFFVGDVLTRRDTDRLQARAPTLTCVNLYGSTETQRAVGYHVVGARKAGTRGSAAALPLGRGMPDAQLLVLDRRGRPAAIGELGEICVRSPHLALGYLRQPAGTADRFVPSPGARRPGERLYRTGDLGRHLPGGEVAFAGRGDNQVKVRGFRIELGEIEAALSRHPSVAQVVAGTHQAVDTDRVLIAWVVPAAAAQPTSAELRQHAGRRLPAFMVPAAFVLIDSVPLTPNSKTDRAALDRRAAEALGTEERRGRGRGRAGLVAPRNHSQLHLVSLFEQVLRENPVGIEDSFFDLGGHSLLATRLFALIEESFGRALPISILFRAPTVAQLAQILRDEGHDTIWSSVVPIHPWGDRPPLFCVHGITGDPFIYRHLVRHLSPDQPIYGLRAQGLDGESPPFLRVGEMAGHYLRELRRIQPRGPYFLAGFCFGGTVASEMSRRLLADGEEVGLLALFDAHANITRTLPAPVVRRYALFHLRKQAERLLEKSKSLPWYRRLAYLSSHSAKTAGRIAARLWRTQRGAEGGEHGEQPDGAMDHGAQPSGTADVAAANRLASRRYSPGFYPGTVTLFRSTEAIGPVFLDPGLGWQVLAQGRVQIHDLPGLHHAMFDEPHVQVLAEKLERCLEAARPQAGSE